MSRPESRRDVSDAEVALGPRMSVLRDPPAVSTDTPRSPEAAGAFRACTLTLAALVAWVVTPPAAVLLFATVGLIGVLRAHRADTAVGHCSLGHPGVIVTYLAVAWMLGAWFTMVEVRALMT